MQKTKQILSVSEMARTLATSPRQPNRWRGDKAIVGTSTDSKGQPLIQIIPGSGDPEDIPGGPKAC